ncbi:MAG: tetratricopeptide repeat protein, partial [Caldisericota bacterium]|nr:tetratricopeptide repeat protein [Caldisericota bacterium]
IIAASLFVIPTPLNKPGTAISQIKGRISLTRFINDFSSGRRMTIWKFTGMMIKDHPILGSGIGTYKYNTLRYQAEFFEQGDNRSIYHYGFADKAHNEYLQLWAELGTIGLAIFLWLIITYFVYGIRYLKREKDRQKQGIMIGLMGAMAAFLVDCFFWFPMHLSSNLSLFWLFIGLTIAMCAKGMEEEKKRRLEAEKIEKRIISGGKDKKEKSDSTANINKNKRSNIFRFKPVLYIVIILLAAFLCITVFRPFMSRIIWYSGLKETRNKDWEKVTDIYERALKWNPYEGYFHYDLGKIFIRRGLGNTALKSFKEAEKYVDFPGMPQNMTAIYIAKGELDKAITELKKAISYQRREETMPPLYIELGDTYLKLEEYKQAEVAYKSAVNKLKRAFSYQPTERTMASLYFDLGNAYLKLGSHKSAEAAFKNAIRINSNLLAEAELEQNITDEELIKLEKLKNRINSNLVDAHHRLAETYLRQNKIEENLVELKKAISITYQNREEKMPPLYVDLGNAYLKLGRYKLAETAFKSALKINTNLFSAHYGLSGVYLRQNKIEEGLIELKKVVKLGPESEEAKYARDAIQKIEQAKSESQPTENEN